MGYYKFSEQYAKGLTYKEMPSLDVTSWSCIFFSNGMYLHHYDEEFFKENKDKKFKYYNRGTMWGNYVVVGDTIKVQVFSPPGSMSKTVLYVWYEIVDKQTIKEIAYKYREPIVLKDLEEYKSREHQPSLGKFIANGDLPNPTESWLFSEKWFWCDKQAYDQYKKNR